MLISCPPSAGPVSARVRRPALADTSAAVRPAMPPPTIKTSQSFFDTRGALLVLQAGSTETGRLPPFVDRHHGKSRSAADHLPHGAGFAADHDHVDILGAKHANELIGSGF